MPSAVTSTVTLVKYDAARTALAAARSVDEVKDIRDKALAMAAYARQAKDTELERWASEIRLRAEVQAGRMATEARKSGQRAGRGGKSGTPKAMSSGDDIALPTIKDLGLTRDQSSDWQRMGRLPDEVVEGLADLGVTRKADVLLVAKSPRPADVVRQIEALPESEIQKIRDGGVSVASALRGSVQAAKRGEAAQSALASGTFSVIAADPPWTYGAGTPSSGHGSSDQHYACMTTDEICAMPVRERTTKDAALFLWVTNPLLPDGLRVIEAWGFEYKTNIVWIKDKPIAGGLGVYVRGQHEILMIATRGSFIPEKAARPVSVLDAATRGHSVKPEEAYAVIEAMYPGQKYLEMFARKPRPGWTVWGAEAGDA